MSSPTITKVSILALAKRTHKLWAKMRRGVMHYLTIDYAVIWEEETAIIALEEMRLLA